MDRFPEAFKRFEKVVAVEEIETFMQLRLAFGSWAGRKWVPTERQIEALNVEAARLRLEGAWRRETIVVRGKPHVRYRDVRTGRFIEKPF
ncbi:hypothetical protein KEJ47_09005 [Candidatus Bathyarchaeota archaeon]|nr:hypothetical protein [Candidatus Bathyarchaeota archaeon]